MKEQQLPLQPNFIVSRKQKRQTIIYTCAYAHEVHTDYYNAGTCTMSDLLEAQTMFQQSKDKFVENVTQYEIRKTEYLQSIGR